MLWKEFWKIIYICARDKEQKWDRILIWSESRENSMIRVNRVNDLNLEIKTKKKLLLWFESNFS